LAQAADILDMPLLDHLIVGDAGRYFSFHRPQENLVAQICPRWNPLTSWMRQIEGFQRVA
jgi:hypothetical protein